MSFVNLLAETSWGWFYEYDNTTASATLDRYGISTAIANMLIADGSILYGSGRLLQIIEPSPIEFSNAKVDNHNQYGLYLWAEPEDTVDVRAHNGDDSYIINMRFEGIELDPYTAVKAIDNAYERVKFLVNSQMWQGQYLTDYYTDSKANVINIEPITSVLPPPIEGETNHVVIEIDGAIRIEINRWD
jgi:hypothetical protein